MDSFYQIHAASAYFAACAFFFFFFFYNVVWKRRRSGKVRTAPEPAGAWPFVGHLPMLLRANLPHIKLGELADKYGPAFTLQLGLNKALVVSSWEVAKECYTVNDRVLATRPSSVAVKIMGYNYALFSLSPYGPYWREARRLSVLHLLSNHRLDLLKHVLIDEVCMSMKELYKLWQKNISTGNALVEMKEWFGDLSLNVIVKMVPGKRYCGASVKDDEGKRLKKAVEDFFHLLGQFVVSDALPFLSWLDIGGHEKAMRRTAQEVDSIMQSWLDEHEQAKLAGVTKKEQDFMDVLLSTLEDNKLPEYDPDVVNKALCFSMIMGAADTTTGRRPKMKLRTKLEKIDM